MRRSVQAKQNQWLILKAINTTKVISPMLTKVQ